MKEKKSFWRRRKKLIIISAVICVLLLIIVLNIQSQREKGVKVTVDKVKKEDLTSIVSASGEVMPKKNVNISAQIPGRITKIGVDEGQEVKAGDFLLQLDPTQYEANAERDRALIRSYKAELIKAEARLARDRNYYDRQKKLYDEQLISYEQLETAKVELDVSQATYNSIIYQIEQAEASLKSTMDNLSKTTYNSPIDGIITSLRVEEGEVAIIGTMNNPGTVLLTIADLSVMEVEIEVDETDVVAVRLGQSADVRVDAFPNLTIKGKVTEIGSSALQKQTVTQEESKDFKVVVTLENPPQGLKPGLSASADIITAEKKGVLAVPISALVLREIKEEDVQDKKDTEEEGVYVVKESRVSFIPVTRGILGEMKVEITSGLEEDQEIVVGPYNALRQLKDDMLITPEEAKKET